MPVCCKRRRILLCLTAGPRDFRPRKLVQISHICKNSNWFVQVKRYSHAACGAGVPCPVRPGRCAGVAAGGRPWSCCTGGGTRIGRGRSRCRRRSASAALPTCCAATAASADLSAPPTETHNHQPPLTLTVCLSVRRAPPVWTNFFIILSLRFLQEWILSL